METIHVPLVKNFTFTKNMRGLQVAVALGTLSLTGLAGAGVGVGWFISVAGSHQDRTALRTTP